MTETRQPIQLTTEELLDEMAENAVRRARADAPPAVREYHALLDPHRGPAELSDTHWLMARFGRQAEATAGLGWNAWRQWLENSRAALAAQWAALRVRVGSIQRRRGR